MTTSATSVLGGANEILGATLIRPALPPHLNRLVYAGRSGGDKGVPWLGDLLLGPADSRGSKLLALSDLWGLEPLVKFPARFISAEVI